MDHHYFQVCDHDYSISQHFRTCRATNALANSITTHVGAGNESTQVNVDVVLMNITTQVLYLPCAMLIRRTAAVVSPAAREAQCHSLVLQHPTSDSSVVHECGERDEGRLKNVGISDRATNASLSWHSCDQAASNN